MTLKKIQTLISEEEALSHIKTAIRQVLLFKAKFGQEDLENLDVIAKDMLTYIIENIKMNPGKYPFGFVDNYDVEFKGDAPILKRHFYFYKSGKEMAKEMRNICMQYIRNLELKKHSGELEDPQKIIWGLIMKLKNANKIFQEQIRGLKVEQKHLF